MKKPFRGSIKGAFPEVFAAHYVSQAAHTAHSALLSMVLHWARFVVVGAVFVSGIHILDRSISIAEASSWYLFVYLLMTVGDGLLRWSEKVEEDLVVAPVNVPLWPLWRRLGALICLPAQGTVSAYLVIWDPILRASRIELLLAMRLARAVEDAIDVPVLRSALATHLRSATIEGAFAVLGRMDLARFVTRNGRQVMIPTPQLKRMQTAEPRKTEGEPPIPSDHPLNTLIQFIQVD